MQKRSLTIAGHQTSLALEPAFWTALEDMARSREQSIVQLIAEIDETREDANLTSAIRVAILNHFRADRSSQ